MTLTQSALVEVVLRGCGPLTLLSLYTPVFVANRSGDGKEYMVTCRLCTRCYHESCQTGEPWSSSIRPSVLTLDCLGCRARGNRQCINLKDEYTVADLPDTMSHWRDKWSKYLPLYPVAYHSVHTYRNLKNSKIKYVKDGPKRKFCHIIVPAMIERDIRSNDFMSALNCK